MLLIKCNISQTISISLIEIASVSHDSERRTVAALANNLPKLIGEIPTYDLVRNTLSFDKMINCRYIGFFNRDAIGKVSKIALKIQFLKGFKHSCLPEVDDTSYNVSMNAIILFSTTDTKVRLDIKIDLIIVPR